MGRQMTASAGRGKEPACQRIYADQRDRSGSHDERKRRQTRSVVTVWSSPSTRLAERSA
jgi:hypothetical protein